MVSLRVKETGLPGAPSPNNLHGPGSLLGTLGAGHVQRLKRKKVKKMSVKDLFERIFPQFKESSGEKPGNEGHGGYLVTDKDGKKHLPTEKNGKRDHGLMGAAWASLHSGYRGNKYEGEGKSEAIAKLKKMYEAENLPLPSESKDADFVITKDANGKYRWTMITSSSFEDRDGEVISQQAHEKDVARMNVQKEFGDLGWRHVGEPSDKNPAPELPMISIGVCDFSSMHGETRIESGTFVNETIPEKLSSHSKELSSSLTFYGDPDSNGVYQDIFTKRRNVTFKENAANLLATFGVQKETRMENQAIEQLEKLIGKEQVASLLHDAELRTKAAKEAGLRQKEAKMHKHEKDGVPHEHTHAIEDDETLADHEHTKEEMDALKPCEKSKEAKAIDELKTKEGADAGLMGVLSQIVARLDLIQLELEQAEDRAGVQEDPGMEQVEEAMAGVQKEFGKALEPITAELAKIKETGDKLTALETQVKQLMGDAPNAVRQSVTQGDKPTLETLLAQIQATNQKETQGDGTPQYMKDLFPGIFKP